MDIQKAIEWQKAFKKIYKGMSKEVDEACNMAIETLEKQRAKKSRKGLEIITTLRKTQRNAGNTQRYIKNKGKNIIDNIICRTEERNCKWQKNGTKGVK